MGLLKKFKEKAKGKFEELKQAKDNAKTAWDLAKPTILAKNYKVPIKKLVVRRRRRIIFRAEGITVRNVRYKNRVGLAVKCVDEYPTAYAKAKKNNQVRTLTDIEYDRVKATYQIWLTNNAINFQDCEITIVKYRDKLMDLELPFSDGGFYVGKDGSEKQWVGK